MEATLVGARVTLDKTDNNDNADNARLNITSCDVCNDECQTLKELEVHMNSHLVEVGPREANSCSLCKRKFKCADNLMDHNKWYHKTCAEKMRGHGMPVCLQLRTSSQETM